MKKETVKTRNQYNMFEISSLIQKSIRRRHAEFAYFAANELIPHYRNYLWKRLLTVSAEDCFDMLTGKIMDLHEKDCNREDAANRKYIACAVSVLLNARKNRDADFFACNLLNSRDRKDIDKYVEDPAEFIGQEMEVKITRVDQRRGKIVFSRRAVLNEEKEKKLAEIWANIHVDDVVEGKVMRFTDYGAFVDIGGIDGLLHISEISWGKLRHPQEVLQIGDIIKVKVLSMNEEKGKISLGLKQTMPEPWSVIDEKYEAGQVVAGKVVQIKEYGAFVELEPGLDGLVHISEIAHKRVDDINEELTIGQEVSAKILEIDKDKRRISLSIKATTAPEEESEAAEADDTEEVEE